MLMLLRRYDVSSCMFLTLHNVIVDCLFKMCVIICECDLQGETPNTPARSSSFRANSKGPATPKRYRTHTHTGNTYTPHLD